MAIRAQDVVPISEARSRLTDLAEEVVAGAEKVLTKNGSAYVALIDARKLDYYHALEAALSSEAGKQLQATLAKNSQLAEKLPGRSGSRK